MNTFKNIAIIALLPTLFLLGCASDVKLEDRTAPVENRSMMDDANTNKSQVVGVDLTKGANANTLQARTIYFDLDSYSVKDEYRPLLEAQAKALANNRGKKIMIEGHTDERGGSEYNLALGQKRAQAVFKTLTVLGAPQAQLEAVSFGKERPAMQGSDEAAWAKNRRVELNNR
jgi:peptidoglycan-associated lipoprotein